MDSHEKMLAQALQCRRLAAGLMDPADIETLISMTVEWEDWAAVTASRQFSADSKSDDPTGPNYAVARNAHGWVVNRGSDRLITRPTLEAAIAEAQRMQAFDDFNQNGQKRL
jgi:hypothetical protein